MLCVPGFRSGLLFTSAAAILFTDLLNQKGRSQKDEAAEPSWRKPALDLVLCALDFRTSLPFTEY
jgi:hypothetical protein